MRPVSYSGAAEPHTCLFLLCWHRCCTFFSSLTNHTQHCTHTHTLSLSLSLQRDLHYFRNMLFHVVYFPAVLGVLFSLEQSELLDPRTPNDMDGGKDIFVELRYKMLLVATAFEVLSIYTGHGGFIIGFGQTFVGVFAFGVFACYGLKLPQDDDFDFTALMTDFAKDTCLYYVVGRVVAGLVWADAKLWYRLTRASPAFVALMTGVTNQDQMQVRAAIEAMSDMSSMSPTDHISNNINVKDRQGPHVVIIFF